MNVVNPVSTFNQCSQLCAAMENTAIRGTSQHKPNLLLRVKGVDFNTKDRKINTEYFSEHVGCAGETRVIYEGSRSRLPKSASNIYDS